MLMPKPENPRHFLTDPPPLLRLSPSLPLFLRSSFSILRDFLLAGSCCCNGNQCTSSSSFRDSSPKTLRAGISISPSLHPCLVPAPFRCTSDRLTIRRVDDIKKKDERARWSVGDAIGQFEARTEFHERANWPSATPFSRDDAILSGFETRNAKQI